MLSTQNQRSCLFPEDTAGAGLLVSRTVQEDPSGTSRGKTEQRGLQRQERLGAVPKQPVSCPLLGLQSPPWNRRYLLSGRKGPRDKLKVTTPGRDTGLGWVGRECLPLLPPAWREGNEYQSGLLPDPSKGWGTKALNKSQTTQQWWEQTGGGRRKGGTANIIKNKTKQKNTS